MNQACAKRASGTVLYGFFQYKRQKVGWIFIITGAPIERMEFENVEYWDELKEIMDWSEENVTSTMHICWGAQAGLFYRYGVKKHELDKKLSGIYMHHTFHKKLRWYAALTTSFYVPHSRYTGADKADIIQNPHLEIVAESDEAGPYLIIGDGGKNIFVTGHPEYDILTLDQEYKRDLAKGLNPDIPVNYYPNNNPRRRNQSNHGDVMQIHCMQIGSIIMYTR